MEVAPCYTLQYTVYTVYTDYIIQTALQCFNSSMYAFYIVEEGYNAIGRICTIMNKFLECPFFLTLSYKDGDKHKIISSALTPKERTRFFNVLHIFFEQYKKVTDKLQVW